MGVGSLNNVKAKRVIGIDASTNSLAFAIFEDGKPVQCGEVMFKGATVEERLLDAKKKTRALVESGVLVADYVAIEKAVMVRNVQVVIDLAMIFGTILGEVMECSPKVERVAPISWQTGIGNPNLKKAEKDAIKEKNPGRKPSWYQNEGRKMRKQRTLDIARNYFNVADGSDNVGDAIGIALHVTKTLTTK